MIKYKYNSKVIAFLLSTLRQEISSICSRLGILCTYYEAKFDDTHFVFVFEIGKYSHDVYLSMRDVFDSVSVRIFPDGSSSFKVLYTLYESE